MNFGLYCIPNNEADVTHFKGKKIKDEGYVHVSRTQDLINVLKEGDVVYVVSVDRFPSVTFFYQFVQAVVRKGASIKILQQSYLDAGRGTVYKNAVRRHIEFLCKFETQYTSKMKNMMRLNLAGEKCLDQCIREIMIHILAETYSSAGILHRGG